MKNFVAYHKVAEWGPYENDGSSEFQHYSGHPQSKLEKTIGQNVWVISGTKIGGQTIFKLCGVYRPAYIESLREGGFIVGGEGEEFDPHIKLNGFNWLTALLKEQRNFSYGLNEIRSSQIVEGLQRISQKARTAFRLADEVRGTKKLPEGARKQVTVNAYERNPEARTACIGHYGYNCFVCGFNFESQYGEIGRDYIHVHHLKPLSTIGKKYEVDPIEDLRPVCPNCHAMLHKSDPPYTPEMLRSSIKKKFR